MPWPSLSDYAQAVGSYPHISILDPKLKGGNPRRGANNYLIAYSGGFSIVFPIEVSLNSYALRCWIADIGEAETRYKEISDYLKQCRLLYFVDFEYVPNGIMVNGDKYPVTRMEWVEGNMLCDFIEHNLQDARCLKTAAVEFQKMVTALHAHHISHGDLQDGNILLKRSGTDVEIKLIDYDSVFVPALRGQPDTIVGVPAYQHPQRIASGGSASEKVDYFSELVIYLSLLSLAEKPNLWSQFGAPTEKRLLFIAEDFKNPDQSDVFQELENLSPDVKQLASKLKEFCKRSVDQLEPLESVLPKTSPAQVAYNQGLAYFRSNRYNEAVVEFEKAIGLDPNYKEAHHGLGLAHFQMSNFGEAKRAAEAALRIDLYYQPAHRLLDVIKSSPVPPKPSRAQVACNQGLIYLHCKPYKYDKAIVEFEKAIGLDPNYKEAHHGLGLAHFQMSNFGEAKSAVEAALRVDQHYQPAHRLLDVIKSSTPVPTPTGISNRWQYITGALAFVLLVCIVILAIQISEKNKALREKQRLQSQLVVQSKETKTQRTIARQLGSENEKLLTQNQKLQYENVRLRRQLDKQYSPLDPLPRDDKQFRAASPQKIYYNSTSRVRLDAIFKNSLGCDAFNKNQYSEAIELFDDAVKSDSQSAIIHYNLGSTYLAMKKYLQAAKSLRRAIDLDPNFKKSYYNLALTQFRRGYRQAAINMARAALSIDKNYQLARQLLGAIE